MKAAPSFRHGSLATACSVHCGRRRRLHRCLQRRMVALHRGTCRRQLRLPLHVCRAHVCQHRFLCAAAAVDVVLDGVQVLSWGGRGWIADR